MSIFKILRLLYLLAPFNEMVLFKELSDVTAKFLIGILLCHFGNEQDPAGDKKRHKAAKRLPKKALDVVSLHALAEFLSDAYSHRRLLGRGIDDGKRRAIEAFPAPQDRCDLFRLFQPQIVHCAVGAQAEMCFLPLFLLLFKTFLPPWVFILWRKP